MSADSHQVRTEPPYFLPEQVRRSATPFRRHPYRMASPTQSGDTAERGSLDSREVPREDTTAASPSESHFDLLLSLHARTGRAMEVIDQALGPLP